jgi:hypothetical protein
VPANNDEVSAWDFWAQTAGGILVIVLSRRRQVALCSGDIVVCAIRRRNDRYESWFDVDRVNTILLSGEAIGAHPSDSSLLREQKSMKKGSPPDHLGLST